jgi:peptidoglycan/LPS O-acetylase OafA/YrhL
VESTRVNINQAQSLALSMIRVLAMSLIIACHFAQAYDYTIAFLLNVGVQIFFLISGFLYGKIDVIQPLDFYKKRLLRVYVPYALLVVAVQLIQGLMGIWQFNMRDVLIYACNLQGFISTSVDGLNHLWFLSVLMICYLLVPWLRRLLNYKPWLLLGVVLVASLVEFLFVQKMYSTCAWIVLFIAGMLYGKYESPKVSLLVLVCAIVIIAGMLPSFRLEHLLDSAWAHYSVWLHCGLAILIFSVIYYLLPKVVSETANLPVLKQLDKISYEVYLVHHPLIMGPLALLTVTPYITLNIAIIMITTFALAYVCMWTQKK